MDSKVENGGVNGDDKGWSWGSSKPVPSIQEIVRNDSQSVPERYIQNQENRPLHSETSPVSSEIPIINLSLLDNGDENERKRLDSACKEWGFFQITNHGVTDKVLHKMKAAVTAFFDLPLVEKKKYAKAANDLQGYGQIYVVSDEQKLDWNDMILLMTLPTNCRNMKYWPTTIPGFKEAVEEYSIEMQTLTNQIFANLSLVMGMEKESLQKYHGEMIQSLRLNYYPTCSNPDLVIGISPHSDESSITLLLQDDDISGLQIKHEGEWVVVDPIPKAIVVNIGDAMEVWSNGMYKSIEHRVITNEKKARISIATFVVPNEEVEIGPLEAVVDDDHPRLYRTVKYADYIKHTVSTKQDGKAQTDYLKTHNV
ncbi:protein SRG1-like [Cornus florida]|uniref:protein SRG1-like n=1 Tax=Cornus florida TaxID=4283 RepID=UPI00289B0EDB|nr:protein SRG1-like [Cornus florida]